MLNALDCLKEAMLAQCQLIEEFSLGEKELHRHVLERSWKKMALELKASEDLSKKIDLWESKRITAFAELRDAFGEPEDAGFYQVVSNLDKDERESVSTIFRNLKMGVLKLRGTVWALEAYIQAVQSTLKDVLGEVSPIRRGTLYSKGGAIKDPDSGPLVLSKHL